MRRPPLPKPEPLTPAEQETLKQAAAQFVSDSYEMITGTGAHAEHERSQVGRCIHCSCGMRVQGRLEPRQRKLRRDG